MADDCCPVHGLVKPCHDCAEQGVVDQETHDELADQALTSREMADARLVIMNKLAELVHRLTDHETDPCDYDHHDLCQAHALHERPCPFEEAKELFLGLRRSEPEPEEETLEWVIGFKEPDACGYFAHWADEEKRAALEAGGLDEDAAADRLYDDPESTNKKFFQYGEYGNVELTLKRDGTGTCRLIPQE